QGLALIAPGEEGELFRVVGTNSRQPLDRRRDCLLPLDLAKFTGAALADPLQRLPELGRRLLLHNAGGGFAAAHAAVDRVSWVALDEADPAIPQMHFDAAAAGAHVAGRVFDLVGDLRRGIDRLLWPPIVVPSPE